MTQTATNSSKQYRAPSSFEDNQIGETIRFGYPAEPHGNIDTFLTTIESIYGPPVEILIN